MTTVNIDPTFLTAHGPAPYVLNSPNTIYVLQQDVNVTGNAAEFGEVFVLKGANIVLNKNGFYITLNGVDTPQITDSTVIARVSEYTVRAVAGNGVFQYGHGTTFDGENPKVVIPPADFPPVVPYGQTT